MTAMVVTDAAGAGARLPAYPLSILIGCAALDEVDAFHALPDGFWRVVTRLVKKISVSSPYQAIFARRDTLARESGKSVETVGRALRWLEDEGFITRQQKARPGLRGSEAHLHPTHKLINALGLGQKRNCPAPNPAPAVDLELSTEDAPSTVKNDASVSALQVHSLLTKKQSRETRASTSHKTRTATVVDGKVIPNELVWMAKERGLAATGVLRLMKLATKAGHRLSDIVALCNASLAPLQGKALFAYVRKLISQNKDYSGMLRKQVDDAQAAHAKQLEQSLVVIKSQEWRGHRFISRDHQRIWVVTGSGFVMREDGQGHAACRMDIGFVEAVMEGKLRRLAA